MEQLNNKWRYGPVNFEIPPLDDLMGMVDGLVPAPAVIDQAIGEEIVLFIRDQTPFMEELRRAEPFQFMMRNGCARNEFGPLVFFVFWIRNPENPAEPIASWDFYLNPNSDEQMGLWRTLASQTHWHVFLVGAGGQQENFFEFKNEYGLNEALDFFKDACANIGTIDFIRAKEAFMREHSIDDLLKMQ